MSYIKLDNYRSDEFNPVTSIGDIRLRNFDGEAGESGKTMNRYSIIKKLTNFNNIFYYMKFVAEALDSKVYDLKQHSAIDADHYDLMFVMVKKIKEAVIDGYNEHLKLSEAKAKVEKP